MSQPRDVFELIRQVSRCPSMLDGVRRSRCRDVALVTGARRLILATLVGRAA
jgi:hypothetical protein